MDAGFGLLDLIRKSLDQIKKEFKGTDKEFEEKVGSKLPEILLDVKQSFSESLIKFYKTKILVELNQKEDKYKAKLFEKYKLGFEFLQIFIDLNKYLGKQYLKELESNVLDDDKLKLNIIFRLHARACQVATEILSLIKSGFADGAHARWRTLHEISVIFLFLLENDSKLSSMYFDYQYIDKLKKGKLFQRHHEKINWEPIDEEQLQLLEEQKEKMIEKYGREFVGQYGWTMDIIERKRDRNLRKIEELVGLDHLRPFYSWASENVHSGMDGISERMSLKDSSKVDYLMFSGPSMYGLADPAQFTTYSMYMISSALIKLDENFENKVMLSILEDLHESTSSEFLKVHIELKKNI